jgi:hypothetical protein
MLWIGGKQIFCFLSLLLSITYCTSYTLRKYLWPSNIICIYVVQGHRL